MAVAYDTGVSNGITSIGASVDVSITTASGSNMVLIAVHAVHRTGFTSSSVTLDPVVTPKSFTNLISQVDGSTYEISIWILKDADITKGSAVTIRGTASGSARQDIHVLSFTGVDQTTSNGTPTGTAVNHTAVSDNVSSSTGDMCVD